MYKIFHGFHLVEAYQDLKKAKRLAKNQTVTRCIKLTIAITLSLILWFLPINTLGIEGLTVIEQRLISIFIFAFSVFLELVVILLVEELLSPTLPVPFCFSNNSLIIFSVADLS